MKLFKKLPKFKMKLRYKLIIFSFLLVISVSFSFMIFFGISGHSRTQWTLDSFRQDQTNIYKQSLKNHVEIAFNLIEENYNLYKSGSIDEETAKENALEQIRILRYSNGSGYFWINNDTKPFPQTLMHPISPELEGQTMEGEQYNVGNGEKKDNIFQEFIRVCENNGEGYVNYTWPKPTKDGLTNPTPKISFVKEFNDWGWILGTGIYVDDIDKQVATKNDTLDELQLQSYSIAISICLIFLLITFGFIILVSRQITKPLIKVKNHLAELADIGGNLTKEIKIKSNDEIGDMAKSLNDFLSKIRNIIASVKKESTSMNEAANKTNKAILNLNSNYQEVSATTQELSAGMEQTAASTQQMNATSMEMEHSVELISNKAQEVASSSSKINNRANEIKEETIKSQNELKLIYSESQIKLKSAIEESKAVEQVSFLADSILQITSQTNLLALNASIEAARAGEAGKGFTVVADEIRVLADDSKKAVSKIQTITETINSSVENLVNSSSSILNFIENKVLNDYTHFLNTSKQYSKDATYYSNISSQLSNTTKELMASINNITKAISEISTSINESTQGTESIATKSNVLTDETSNVANLANEVKSSSENLISLLNQFKV